MSTRPLGTWLLVGAGVAVAASLVAAVGVIGSPAEQRLHRLDERRVRDLDALKMAIEAQHHVDGALPASLAVLARGNAIDAQAWRDPQTGHPYEYRVLDARRYELCATFARDSRQPRDRERAHPAGRHCMRHAVEAAKSTMETR